MDASPPFCSHSALRYLPSVCFWATWNPDQTASTGTRAKIVLFNGASIVDQSDIPTGTANQGLCDGDANGNYSGCGNNETVWVEYDGSAITDILIMVGEVTSDAAQNSNKLSISGLTLGGICQVTLPVVFSSFSVQALGGENLLKWQTESEFNNVYFSVEHSLDGASFEEIGRVEGAGTSYGPQSYDFLHKEPAPGPNYYRLRQVDLDGSYSYSEVRMVVQQAGRSVRLFPNPANEQLTVLWQQDGDEQVPAMIFDLIGRQVKALLLSPGEEISLEQLPAGAYLLRLQFPDKVEVLEFIRR